MMRPGSVETAGRQGQDLGDQENTGAWYGPKDLGQTI